MPNAGRSLFRAEASSSKAATGVAANILNCRADRAVCARRADLALRSAVLDSHEPRAGASDHGQLVHNVTIHESADPPLARARSPSTAMFWVPVQDRPRSARWGYRASRLHASAGNG